MSEAGKRSSQGDEYQIRIATSWLIRLLEDDSLTFIQAEAMSLPGDDQPVSVDDVVVVYRDGSKRFIQAKKNQTEHQVWKLTDTTLKAELCKARDQLERVPDSVVEFCSRSPFGCQSALKIDPPPASNFDPPQRVSLGRNFCF